MWTRPTCIDSSLIMGHPTEHQRYCAWVASYIAWLMFRWVVNEVEKVATVLSHSLVCQVYYVMYLELHGSPVCGL